MKLVYIIGLSDSRIDGDSEGATLYKTSMSEKETVIGDMPTVLQPTDQPDQQDQERETEEPQKR